MAHITLYRKYRSQVFEDVIGQNHITKTLQSAISNGRIAHAYLFVGPRGTGKTSTARILAKALNCEVGPTPTPCNVCSICNAITTGNSIDVLELDAASESGVDEVRETIVEMSRYAPMEARYRVFIIDEVHDLSSKAFDALLKTIEEPPPHVVFVLATTEYNRVPLTIRSRCQRYEFHRGTVKDIVNRLKFVCEQENIMIEPGALSVIARFSDGAFRDALTLLEQAMLTSNEMITESHVVSQLGMIEEQIADQMLLSAAAGDTAELMELADSAVRQGKDPLFILEGLLMRLSELSRALYGLDSDFDPERKASNHDISVRIGQSNLLKFRTILADAHKEMRSITLPRLWLELTLTKLTEHLVSQKTPSDQSSHQTAPIENTKHAQTENRPSPNEFVFSENLQEQWNATVAQLTAQYKAAGKMLVGTSVVRHEGKLVEIGIPGKFQFERLEENKNDVRGIIIRTFRKTIGDESIDVRFVLQNSNPSPHSSEKDAVQLPVEGENLSQLFEEVFDIKPSKEMESKA